MKRVICTFNKNDLKYDYDNRYTCPIAQCLKRHKVPVRYVDCGMFVDNRNYNYFFTKKLRRIENILQNGDKKKLVGVKFQVFYNKND